VTSRRADAVRNRRRILCVFPAYAPSFGTFENAYPLIGGVRAFMPPQGLLVIAAYLPREWEVHFVDENMRRATEAEFAWADAVLVSGMHVQRPQIEDICARAHACGKIAVLGGPSVSGAPEHYPRFDYLHVGELGDATDHLIAALDAGTERPAAQVVLRTETRLPLTEFPPPAYALIEPRRYFLGSVQFSSGCPYRCEFCDIPALYGRNPRLKTPGQVLAELDTLLARGNPGAVYFVDDNFIGNRRAARELATALVGWQKRNGYPFELACEATLNIAKLPELLELMREAYFTTIFCGIETPDPEALRAMSKQQNATLPIIDSIRTLNGYGFEVVSGIILGLDTDTRGTGRQILDFVDQSQIPMLTINLLQALPRTPLWDRLAAEGRLVEDPLRESNVRFRLPYDEVVDTWRRCMAEAYAPERVFRRFAHNAAHTYPNRIKPPASQERASWRNLGRGLGILARLLVKVGLLSDYRATFWALAGPLLRAGRIEDVIHVGVVAHHLITFARSAASGQQNASFYSERTHSDAEAA
jgi:radical SAM superfamily enzyme YgiQ (UPF0313 family)